MLPLLLSAAGCPLGIVASIRTVDVATVTPAAQGEQPPAVVVDTLDLSEIVHSRARPPGTRPHRGTRAITVMSNASTRGDPGLGVGDSGPFSLVAVARIVRWVTPEGQLRRRVGLPGIPRFQVPVDTCHAA